jgi:hypothetical protein
MRKYIHSAFLMNNYKGWSVIRGNTASPFLQEIKSKLPGGKKK